MSIALRPRTTPQNDLHAAICLLGLITARPANLDELFIETERSAAEEISDDTDDGTESLEGIEIGSMNDEKKRDIDALRNNILDRLAETLARFKSDPKRGKGSILDPKHVSSAMMITYDDENKVKILCAKNEGLDQGHSTDDTDFLDSWKVRMERISRAGTATEEDNAYMFDLVLNYQQPRINYYVEKLKHALRFEEPAKSVDHDNRPVLSDVWLQRLPNARSRIWIDDSGNEFTFLARSSDEADNNSKIALSAQSLKNVEDEVSTILCVVDKLSTLDIKMTNGPRQEALLKELLPSLFAAWRSPRFQASIKAQLHTRFQKSKSPQKRQSEVMTALKFLCRCYYSVIMFIQGAETMQIFQNIEYIPVPVPPKPSKVARAKVTRAEGTPVEIAKSLGLLLRGIGWVNHLEKQTTKAAFQKLRGETCHVHAEIQVLLYQNSLAMSPDEKGEVHPYIGCSKRCCLLCWSFIRIHGTFYVRGTHESIMHRWEIPMASLTEPATSKFQSTSDVLFSIINTILQNMFDQSFPLKHLKLLAQSSAALSTTQTVLDREKVEMEKSQLRMRQMMMGQFMTDDGLLVVENYQKPGFVTVIGGTLTKVKEMTCQEAEIYKENHIRGKFGLEKSDQMPPKQSSVEKNICRRPGCGSPSNFQCSACRMKYCSKYCQKKDWRRHVFTCTIKNRPNDVDYLKIILARWSRSTKESRQARVLLDLYSDDSLCKTFGFNNCLNSGEVNNLFCIYGHMISKLSTNGVQAGVHEGNLGDYIEVFAELTQHSRKDSYCDCPCFAWFLGRRSTGFEIPNWEASYAYQIFGLRRAEHVLSIDERDDELDPLSEAEKVILSLYSMLFRDFNNIPGLLSSQWFDFGFCFCTNDGQRMDLAKLYLQLVESTASIGDIARAYELESISSLMKSRGLDLSFLEKNGIILHRPGLDERGIYRLIAEVNHALSGHFCYCFMQKSYCHPKFETHLSRESEGDYGFHGTNTWERWQLLNFYKYVFGRPNFNARKMQEAKRHSDRDRLSQYLNSLVPDFQEKIRNRVLGDLMFPKIKASVRFPYGRPECCCVMHNTIGPEGLNWGTLLELSYIRGMSPEVEEVEPEVIN